MNLMRVRGATAMLKQPNVKKLGGIKLTYEILEVLLELKSGSIQAVKADVETQTVIVIHDDEGRPVWDISPGMQVPMWIPKFQYKSCMPPRKEDDKDGRK